jgi:hypothetical protein
MSKRSEVERIIQYLTTKTNSVERLRTILRAAERIRKEMPKEWQRSGDTTKLRAKIAYDRAKARILGE